MTAWAEQLVAAGRIVERDAGVELYRAGDAGDSFFVVIAGAVELRGLRRGDREPGVLRTAATGDSFGEEALLAGLTRRATAVAAAPARIAEIPVPVLRRVLSRTDASIAAREERYLQRAASRDLVLASALGRGLGAADVELLLDGLQLERVERGAHLVDAGDRADRALIIADGLVQLQHGDRVVAYLQRGDLLGDAEALAGAPHPLTAIAAGDTWCATIPRELLRSLADRHPDLLPRLRRIAASRDAAHAAAIGAAEARSTRHVFGDLYRMQMARSLLAIDLDTCVRCGHCAWSCGEVHGASRLVRRGDKVVTGAATLLLPNTCQHCKHAACMVDCPTGAIGRDPDGEVFIRAELCTGCGNCVRSCPWDNIQLAGAVAVKCDLCRGYQAPACVEACPTGSIVRLDPSRDIAEVAQVLGRPLEPRTDQTSHIRSSHITYVIISYLAGVVVAAAALGWLAGRGWTPGQGPGLAAGLIAAALIVGLAGYAIPKRLVRRRLAPRARGLRVEERAPRSRTRGPLALHLGLGALLPAAALAHAGLRAPSTPGGALVLALGATVVVGVLAAIAYRAVPPALTRLERRGALPEDLAGEADALSARLFRELSGTGERVKRVAERLLLPYAAARLGAVALVASGRSLGEEERRLRARIDAIVEGRALDGIDPLIRIAVERRALPARRALTALLRIWLPLHVVTAAMSAALLVAHVVTAVWS